MATTSNAPSRLYPAIEPYNTGRLKVSDIHELYVDPDMVGIELMLRLQVL